jgi:hypothetical protein
VRVWDPEKIGEINYDATIIPVLQEWASKYNIIRVVYDKYQLKYLMDRVNMGTTGTSLRAISCRSFNQQGERRESDSMLVHMIRDRQFHHDGTHSKFREQLLQAAGRHDSHENTKLHIEKRDTSSKIDSVIAASMGNYECLRMGI